MKTEIGKMLGVNIYSTCLNCEQEYQINKEQGKIDYVCPHCGTDNRKNIEVDSWTGKEIG